VSLSVRLEDDVSSGRKTTVVSLWIGPCQLPRFLGELPNSAWVWASASGSVRPSLTKYQQALDSGRGHNEKSRSSLCTDEGIATICKRCNPATRSRTRRCIRGTGAKRSSDRSIATCWGTNMDMKRCGISYEGTPRVYHDETIESR
jgi:hypothetical protein